MLDLWELEHTPDAPVVSLEYVTYKGGIDTAVSAAQVCTVLFSVCVQRWRGDKYSINHNSQHVQFFMHSLPQEAKS